MNSRLTRPTYASHIKDVARNEDMADEPSEEEKQAAEIKTQIEKIENKI